MIEFLLKVLRVVQLVLGAIPRMIFFRAEPIEGPIRDAIFGTCFIF
jgi:hypothetical protein